MLLVLIFYRFLQIFANTLSCGNDDRRLTKMIYKNKPVRNYMCRFSTRGSCYIIRIPKSKRRLAFIIRDSDQKKLKILDSIICEKVARETKISSYEFLIRVGLKKNIIYLADVVEKCFCQNVRSRLLIMNYFEFYRLKKKIRLLKIGLFVCFSVKYQTNSIRGSAHVARRINAPQKRCPFGDSLII